MNIYEKLANIQQELKAPKSQYNKFGGYPFRNQEDILTAVKPLLMTHKCTMIISDELAILDNRYYIKANVDLFNNEKPDESLQSCAYAREAEERKGMDASQITGSASSYARKYALNGLFLIDDVKDADHAPEQPTSDDRKKDVSIPAKKESASKVKYDAKKATSEIDKAETKKRVEAILRNVIEKTDINKKDLADLIDYAEARKNAINGVLF